MNTYVVFRRSGWSSRDDLEKAAGRSAQVGQHEMAEQVRWIRSYVTEEVGGRVGTVCIYQATHIGAIKEHALRSGLPCDLVIPLLDTVIINEDPGVPV